MQLSRYAPLITLALLPFTALAGGCASTQEATGAAAAPAQAGSGDAEADVEAKAEKAAKELRAKEHALQVAQVQLELTRLSAGADEAEARRALEAAQRGLEAAQAQLENFSSVVRGLEESERVLSVDRSKQSLVEAQEELAELEAMYAQEEFAETTKELVLTRGRHRLEMTRRSLAHAEQRLEQLRGFELPERERELTEKVTQAERALAAAETRLEKLPLEQRVALMKAEHELGELEREIAELKSKAGGDEDVDG